MTDRNELPDEYLDLLDDYCSGEIDEEGVRRLEAFLLGSPAARQRFVAYFQLHTDLQFAVRAGRAASAVLGQVAGGALGATTPRRRPRLPRRWALAAGVLLAATAGLALGRSAFRPAPPAQVAARGPNVAWLVNAQNCQWDGDASGMPGRDMRAGKVLRLRRGLAELEFDHGARLILQGPASLQLLSGNAARLLRGTLTARVPRPARGFTIFSPSGKVVDLGTEFGLSVDERGATAVRVFAGTVEAAPASGGAPAAAGVTLHEDQAARIDGRTVSLRPGGEPDDSARFVRAIELPPVITPRTVTLDFRTPAAGSLLDALGRGTGLTHRLPGTGGALALRDPNLRLDPRRGALELTTTLSDINTQVGMPTGEYLGVRLADLGFTGREDFAVAVTIPNIPGLEVVGQFGLYTGSASARNIRGGLISTDSPDRYEMFLVNNHGGRDSDLYEVGLSRTGDDLRMTLRRTAGKFSMVVENLTRRSSSTLSIAQPTFLDEEHDLYAGVFGANTQSDVRKTLTIKELSATVWTVSPPKEAAAPGAGRTARAGPAGKGPPR
jgi:hypothetical protein